MQKVIDKNCATSYNIEVDNFLRENDEWGAVTES